jgi:glycine dehydrogenase
MLEPSMQEQMNPAIGSQSQNTDNSASSADNSDHLISKIAPNATIDRTINSKSVAQGITQNMSVNGSEIRISNGINNGDRYATLLESLPELAGDAFADRHIGPSAADIQDMLTALGFESLDQLIAKTVPAKILSDRPLDLPTSKSEYELLKELKAIANHNQVFRSFIGMGYANCITPAVIQRNILENPGWYTQYTPYQAEIAQGRLEALLNFQTMAIELSGMEIANASLSG